MLCIFNFTNVFAEQKSPWRCFARDKIIRFGDSVSLIYLVLSDCFTVCCQFRIKYGKQFHFTWRIKSQLLWYLYSSHNDKQETNLLQKMLIEKWNQFIHNWWNIVERFVCMYNERAFETFRSNIEFQLCWRSLFNNRCCWTQHSNKTHWQFKLKLFFMSLSGVYAPKKSLLQFESFWQKILFRIQIAYFSN